MRVVAPQPAEERALDLALSEGGLRTLFQPVVDLPTGDVVGWEALTRGPAGGPVEGPDALFAVARACRRLAELDWACRCQAFREAASSLLGPPYRLFVNAEPQVLGTACPVHLLPDWLAAHKSLDVVVEMTERYLCDAPADLLRVSATLRELGWEVALDDVGANDAGVALLPVLEPDVVKLDAHLLADRLTPTSRSVLRAVEAYVSRTGARVVAEGVETEAQRARALALGADWGQGWLFGRPGPLRLPEASPAACPPVRRDGVSGADPRVPGDPYALLPGDELPLSDEGVRRLLDEVVRGALHVGPGSLVVVVLGRPDLAPHGLPALLDRLHDLCALVVVLTREIDLRRPPVVRTTALASGDPLRGDAAAVVLGPDHATAFHARQAADGSWCAVRTGDAGSVGEAARVLLGRTAPLVRPTTTATLA